MSDTTASKPDDATAAADGSEQGHSRNGKNVARAVRVLIAFLVVVTVVLGGLRFLTSTSPYVELSSGPVVGLNGTTPDGISITTVDSQRLSWGGYLIAKMGGQGANIFPASEVSPTGALEQNTIAMRAAKTDAAIVAVYAVTGKMPAKYYGATVNYTLTGMPATKAGVKPGDIILAVNGTKPLALGNIAKLLQRTKGGRVELGLVRGKEHLTITMKPKWVPKSKSWKVGVGLSAVTRIDYKALPKPLVTGSVEGPSGGLMFTLAYIAELSPGSLSPVPIAGTGTIDIDGGVGDIGGVAYKVAGAIAAGDKVFFVPSANAVAARKAAKGRIQIVVVNGIGDALHWLCAHGATNKVCKSPGLYARLKTLLRPAE